MKVYEAIISILEKKGSMPITEICHEVNEVLHPHRKKTLKPSHIKSIVTKKKDLFCVKGGEISISPDKYPCILQAMIEGFEGISYQIRVNFTTNKFVALEWRNKESREPFANIPAANCCSMEEFKRELFALSIWEWKPVYDSDQGIIIEGKYWTVKLKTKGKVYQSEGIERFPNNWNKFCKALEKLTGFPFR